MAINQAKVDKRAAEHYNPLYKKHADDADVKAECLKIVAEERARDGLDEIQFTRGVRTRIHALLQERETVPDPALDVIHEGKARPTAEIIQQLDHHHNEQTAHFQALWQHADALAAEAIMASKKGS